jgi:hypothetical protein
MQIISHRNFTLVAHDDSEGETRVANYNKQPFTVHRSQFPQHVPDEYASDPHLEMMRNDGHVFTFEPPASAESLEIPIEIEAPAAESDEPESDQSSPKKKWRGAK